MIKTKILRELAESATGITFEEIPEPIIGQANRCLLDSTGCYSGGRGVTTTGRPSSIAEGPAFGKSYDKKKGFQNEIEARFSIPYITAALAYYAHLNHRTFHSSPRSSSTLKPLARRVTTILDEDRGRHIQISSL